MTGSEYPIVVFARRYARLYGIPYEETYQEGQAIAASIRPGFDPSRAQWGTYLWNALACGLPRWRNAYHRGAMRLPRRRDAPLESLSLDAGDWTLASDESPEQAAFRADIRRQVRRVLATKGEPEELLPGLTDPSMRPLIAEHLDRSLADVERAVRRVRRALQMDRTLRKLSER